MCTELQPLKLIKDVEIILKIMLEAMKKNVNEKNLGGVGVLGNTKENIYGHINPH